MIRSIRKIIFVFRKESLKEFIKYEFYFWKIELIQMKPETPNSFRTPFPLCDENVKSPKLLHCSFVLHANDEKRPLLNWNIFLQSLSRLPSPLLPAHGSNQELCFGEVCSLMLKYESFNFNSNNRGSCLKFHANAEHIVIWQWWCSILASSLVTPSQLYNVPHFPLFLRLFQCTAILFGDHDPQQEN